MPHSKRSSTGAIRYEIRSKLLSWIVLLGAGGLLVASVAAMGIVRPIRQMTATAHHILADEGALHERLGELISTLPLHRNDEIGDVGRASKRLFEEIITAQEQLEKRVEARTAELSEANRQLEGLAKEKDAFLANVSHELRTPSRRYQDSSSCSSANSSATSPWATRKRTT